MFEMVITSSVLILALMLVRKICWGKISRRLQYSIWILVAVKLLVPTSVFTSPLSVMNVVESAGKAVESHWQAKQDEVDFTETDLETDHAYLQPGAGVITIEKSDISIETGVQNGTDTLPNEEALVATGIASAPDWKEMFLEAWKYIYIIGVLITGSCLLLCNLKFHKQLTANRQLLGTEGRLKVYQASGISSPCLWGIWRPGIYLTEQSLEPEERKNHILQHELTHYRHLDHIWALVRSLCLALYWFHPLVWAAAKLSMEDSELACDEGTFLRLGEEQRTAYGRTLIEMMTEQKKSSRLWYCTADMVNNKSEIKKRITAIAFYKKQIIWITVPVIVAAVFLSACTAGRKEDTNIFEYMFDVEDGAYSDYMYTPQGLTYGMSQEEVIEAEGLTDYTENHSGNIIQKITVADVKEDIKELIIGKYYEFVPGYGLSKVEYYFEVTEEDKDAFTDLLKEQSTEYMPTGIGDDLEAVIWGEPISFKISEDFTSDWRNRQGNKSVASFEGMSETADNSGHYVFIFKAANGDDYWSVYNLFYDNFFSYAINLENEEYTYDFGMTDLFARYQYGDDKQHILQNHNYGPYAILEENTDSFTVGAVFRDMPTDITEYAYARKFVFDEESKLAGVEYTLSVKEEEFDTLCNLLYYQAGEYMPMATEGVVKDIQDGKDVSWSADDANGKTTSRVELTFTDTGDGRKEVTLAIHIEE